MHLTEEQCRICIQLLRDRSQDSHTRVAAVDSLMYCNTDAARAVLFDITIDANEPDYLREEAAGSLGTLWAESAIEYERLIQILPPFLDEVVADFDAYGIRLDKAQLDTHRQMFEQRYHQRHFMHDGL